MIGNIKDLDVKDVVIVDFSFAEDPSKSKRRPAIVIQKDERNLRVLIVKVTKTLPRNSLDYEILDWVKANLDMPSTASCSQLRNIGFEEIHKKIGTLEDRDFNEVVDRVVKCLGQQQLN